MHARSAQLRRPLHGLQVLRTEERTAREVLEGLPDGAGRQKLEEALARVTLEASEVEGSLAALYATLLSLQSQPSFNGLTDTLDELEAEAEVSRESAEALIRARQASMKARQ